MTSKNIDKKSKVFDKPQVVKEVEELGITACDRFSMMCGINMSTMNTSDLRRLYWDVIKNPQKFIEYAKWLKPKFKKYIDFNIPMRIYVGGQEFIMRGDDILEKSLNKVLDSIDEFIRYGKATPKRISALLYYLNKMVS